jgi:hypothetical protein
MTFRFAAFRIIFAVFGLITIAAPDFLQAQPTAEAVSAFNSYVSSVESRLAHQHQLSRGFLAPENLNPQDEARLRRGDLIIERLTPREGELSGALLHHWRATAFAPGLKAVDFERLMKNFSAYPQYFSPQVAWVQVLEQQPDHYQVAMRVRQHHGLTVVLDMTYDIAFARLDAQHGYSISRSTRIAEVASSANAAGRDLKPNEEHGFLWRMNTYWTYQEGIGGLYMQVESLSLTRSIPYGLGWAVGAYAESIPRESLEFTLRSTCSALRQIHNQPPIGRTK